jgi:hypothetical protein
VEVAADEDDAAQRTVRTALEAATMSAERRSYILSRAVAALADDRYDDSVLVRRLPLANRYLIQLEALPVSGHASIRDSLAVLHRVYDSEVAVLEAYCRLGMAHEVLSHTARTLDAVRRFSLTEPSDDRRFEAFSRIPWESVATIVLGLRGGRAQLDSLKARAFAIAGPTEEARQAVVRRMAPADSLGAHAPPIVAHAWFNVTDSTELRHGSIRVVKVVGGGCRSGCSELELLQQVQDHATGNVQVMLLASTIGYVGGAELVEASEEVDWVRVVLVDRQHLSMPIAIWAGTKQPAAFGGRLPASSPNESFPWAKSVTVIDGRGIIRGYVELSAHRGRMVLARALAYLQAEASGPSSNVPRPPELIP